MKTDENPSAAAPAAAGETFAPATVQEAAPAPTETNTLMLKDAESAYQSSMSTLYISAFSFILGVLFTVLILLILDFMRRNSNDAEK